MRVFTDAEKQQLQSKIEDEQERQRALRESLQIEKETESKRSKGIISTALSYKYSMLGFILLLIILNIRILLPRQNYDSHIYSLPILTLAMLFNHIAYQFTKKGWLSRLMKTIAWIWMLFLVGYLLWLFTT